MNRDARDLVFTSVILAVTCAFVWEAQQWSIRARLFPWVVGFSLIGLTVALLVTKIIRIRHPMEPPLPASDNPEPNSGVAAEPVDSPVESLLGKRGLSIVAWLFGFAVIIWLLGFALGGTVATLAYMRLAAHESWRTSLVLTAGTAGFFFLMINGLRTPFPPGALFQLAGG